jgi:hypothetical protein
MERIATLLALGSLALLGACLSTPAPQIRSPVPTASSGGPVATAKTPSITPPATATPSPSPSPTPAPTLGGEAVAELTEAGATRLTSRGIDPLCLRWEDTDDDGEPEWAGLYLRPSDPPRLEGFVLDGEDWHDIRAPAEDAHGLGTHPTCELEVRDVNADGRTEILIGGHTQDNVDLLHLFTWRQPGYTLLASFRGDAGIEVLNTDGDLHDEIVARYDAGAGLAWEQVHTWDGSHYGWTWERYTWLHADHPHAYLTDDPEHAAISFYLALDDRDLPGAYDLFDSTAEASQPYETWAVGFDTMLSVEVGSVQEIERAGVTSTVTAQVRSYDNVEGYVIGRLWDVTWTLVREERAWQLQRGTSEQLDRWEAPYFP